MHLQVRSYRPTDIPTAIATQRAFTASNKLTSWVLAGPSPARLGMIYVEIFGLGFDQEKAFNSKHSILCWVFLP